MDKITIEKRLEEIENETHRLEMSYEILPDRVKDRLWKLHWEYVKLQKELRGEA